MTEELDKKLKEKETSYRIFDSIYKRYDFLNHLFSFGLDYLWRRKVARRVPIKTNQVLLDLASGTGDVAFSILKRCPQIVLALGCDMSANMLGMARQKAARKKIPASRMTCLQGDAGRIPLKDGCCDVITMAFGIRNVPSPSKVLEECRRVMRKNGNIMILEFSLPENKLIKRLHLFYLRHIIPNIGALISKDADAYAYLNKTIETFPYGKAFCQWMRDAGFRNVGFKPLTFGVATLYTGEK